MTKSWLRPFENEDYGFQDILCTTHGYVPVNKQKVENETGAVKTCNIIMECSTSDNTLEIGSAIL